MNNCVVGFFNEFPSEIQENFPYVSVITDFCKIKYLNSLDRKVKDILLTYNIYNSYIIQAVLSENENIDGAVLKRQEKN